jgi:hypothetical protein
MVSYSLLLVMAFCFTTINGTVDQRQYLTGDVKLCFDKLFSKDVFKMSAEQRSKLTDAIILICQTSPHIDRQLCGKYPPPG